jgi:Utp14 protein.
LILQSRQELAQQLAVSRDLTQKIQIESSSDDEEEEENNDEKVVPADSDNPWIAPKTSTEVDEFVSAYRKYWEEHNQKSLGQTGTVNNNTSHNKETEEREVGNYVKKGHTGNHETACADQNFEGENDKGTQADKIDVGSHTSESLSGEGENNKDCLITANVPVSEERSFNSSKNNQSATPDKQDSTFSRTEMQPKMKTLSRGRENITTGQLCNNMEILPNGKLLALCKQKCTVEEVNDSTVIQPQKKKLSPNKQKNTAQQETSITGVQPHNKTFSLSDERCMIEQENDSTEHIPQWKISPNNETSTVEQNNFSIDRQPERIKLSPNQQKKLSEEVNNITQVQQERKNVSQNKPVSIAEKVNSNMKKTKFVVISDSCKYKPFESHLLVTATTNSWVVTPIDVEVGTVDEVNGLVGKKKKRNKRKGVESRAVKNKVKIGELFDDVEEKLKEKVGKKLKKLKVELKVKDESKTEETNSESDNEGPSLKLKQMHVRPQLDEELVEQPHDKFQEEGSSYLSLKKMVAESRVQEEMQEPPVDCIDPNKFIAMKPRHLQTGLPDLVTKDEAIDDSEDESTERQMTITEAFAEDDVVAEFR